MRSRMVHMRSRSVHSRLRGIFADAHGVHAQVRSSAGDWFPVSWSHPLGLAADIGVLRDALKQYDAIRTESRVEKAMSDA